MRRAVVALLAAAGLASPAAADAARVDVMVVGKQRVLVHARSVALKARTVDVGRRRCATGRATALSALVATRVDLQVRDYGSCGRRARDSSGLYVRRVGPDRERGRGGWVYKVGHRVATNGAADPAGPFGDGRRLRRGQQVLWFWCRVAGACQRTLEARPEPPSEPGGPVRVRVRGHDDAGEAIAIAGATVRVAGTAIRATTGSDGVALLTAPSGRHEVVAEKRGLVRSFPAAVRVP